MFNAIGQHLHTEYWPDNKFILRGIKEFFVGEYFISGYKEIDLLEFEPKCYLSLISRLFQDKEDKISPLTKYEYKWCKF